MDHYEALSVPLMRVAPSFYKEKTFWEKRLADDEQFGDIGSIDNIDYNPHDHHYNELLVTSLARLSMYDSNELEILRTYKTNTQYQVYGGCFRKNDGRLVAAGSEEGKLFVFESQNTNPLRVIDLKAPTHRILFWDNNLVAFSDDSAVRIIDVGSGNTIRTYGDKRKSSDTPYHKDYVRCGCLIDKLVISGSYDHVVKLWDPRLDQPKPVMEYNHGHAVESFCTRRDTLLISVGGNKLHVFDMIAGKTLTSIIPKHHKTITSAANHDDKYLLTGALDGYLNVLDFNYEYITRFNYDEAQILSLTANPKLLAVGFNNHRVHVKRFKDFIKKSNDEMAELEKLQSGYFGPNMVTRYIHEAIAENQDPVKTKRALMAISKRKTPVELGDDGGLCEAVVIAKLRRFHPTQKSMFYGLLKSYRHTQALRIAVSRCKHYPADLIFIIQELLKRDKLRSALLECNKLITFMNFISSRISDIRHNRLLLDCGLILIDLMLSNRDLIQQDDNGFWPSVERLSESISEELRVVDSCVAISAQLNTVIY